MFKRIIPDVLKAYENTFREKSSPEKSVWAVLQEDTDSKPCVFGPISAADAIVSLYNIATLIASSDTSLSPEQVENVKLCESFLRETNYKTHFIVFRPNPIFFEMEVVKK